MNLVLIFLLCLWFGWPPPTGQPFESADHRAELVAAINTEATALGWTVYGA